jgi:hypothetical protein
MNTEPVRSTRTASFDRCSKLHVLWVVGQLEGWAWMEITMRPSRELAPGVWETQVEDPDELSLFGKPLQESGPTSVVQVTGEVTPDKSDAALRFDHRYAQVLNRGSSERTIVIVNTQERNDNQMSTSNTGDDRFLAEVSANPRLRFAGDVLTRVRATRPGNLRYYEKTGKYAETPDNYWAVKPQHQDGSLRIIVRGAPERFGTIGSLQIKPDMNGYSAFKISSVKQVDDAVAAIMQARRR